MRDPLSKEPTRARLAAATAMLDPLLHDLKQPMNLIRVVAQDVNLDSMKGRLDEESIPQSMQEIIAAVDQLVSSIDRLRAFARPPEGGFGIGSRRGPGSAVVVAYPRGDAHRP